MRPIFIILIGAFVLLGAMSANLYLNDQQPQKDKLAQFLKGGDFSLSSSGGRVSLQQFKGQPVVLYFGYTHCPDVCPTGLAKLRSALKLFPKKTSDVVILFITLDPERDDVESLAKYVSYFSKQMKGLSGSLEETAAVAKQYGVFYEKSFPDPESDDYGLVHTAKFYLIDSKGRLIRVMDQDSSDSELVQSIIALK